MGNTNNEGASIGWEPSRGGDLFPHPYEELPVAVARHVTPLNVDGDGHPRQREAG